MFLALLLLIGLQGIFAKDYVPDPYSWTSQSKNSSESMPCGGHDIGMNVWVENGDLLVYLSRSGFFDENNTLLKAGRLRLHIESKKNVGKSIFNSPNFSQTLCLDDGAVYVQGGGVTVRLWADVFSPTVFATVSSKETVSATLSYESWRHHDRNVPREACQQLSWKWLTQGQHKTFADSIRAEKYTLCLRRHRR